MAFHVQFRIIRHRLSRMCPSLCKGSARLGPLLVSWGFSSSGGGRLTCGWTSPMGRLGWKMSASPKSATQGVRSRRSSTFLDLKSRCATAGLQAPARPPGISCSEQGVTAVTTVEGVTTVTTTARSGHKRLTADHSGHRGGPRGHCVTPLVWSTSRSEASEKYFHLLLRKANVYREYRPKENINPHFVQY